MLDMGAGVLEDERGTRPARVEAALYSSCLEGRAGSWCEYCGVDVRLPRWEVMSCSMLASVRSMTEVIWLMMRESAAPVGNKAYM